MALKKDNTGKKGSRGQSQVMVATEALWNWVRQMKKSRVQSQPRDRAFEVLNERMIQMEDHIGATCSLLHPSFHPANHRAPQGVQGTEAMLDDPVLSLLKI